MKTVKETLEDGTLGLEDEIDYADMTEEEYKNEIERLNKRLEINILIQIVIIIISVSMVMFIVINCMG